MSMLQVAYTSLYGSSCEGFHRLLQVLLRHPCKARKTHIHQPEQSSKLWHPPCSDGPKAEMPNFLRKSSTKLNRTLGSIRPLSFAAPLRSTPEVPVSNNTPVQAPKPVYLSPFQKASERTADQFEVLVAPARLAQVWQAGHSSKQVRKLKCAALDETAVFFPRPQRGLGPWR